MTQEPKHPAPIVSDAVYSYGYDTLIRSAEWFWEDASSSFVSKKFNVHDAAQGQMYVDTVIALGRYGIQPLQRLENGDCRLVVGFDKVLDSRASCLFPERNLSRAR